MDEEALLLWQDVLDSIVAGRPNDLACPYCRHRPLLVEEVDYTTKVTCSKCGKYLQGRFAQQ